MNFWSVTMVRLWITVLSALGFCAVKAHAWQSDNGGGTFTNPPLYADYPDPDIIRVGGDFYFATTTFVNSPGLTILHSLDLVNWEIVSHVILRLEGRGQYDLKNGGDYRRGVFAPSLRFFQWHVLRCHDAGESKHPCLLFQRHSRAVVISRVGSASV